MDKEMEEYKKRCKERNDHLAKIYGDKKMNKQEIETEIKSIEKNIEKTQKEKDHIYEKQQEYFKDAKARGTEKFDVWGLRMPSFTVDGYPVFPRVPGDRELKKLDEEELISKIEIKRLREKMK